MHEVVSSSPIVMHIFHILLYQHKLVHTSMYWSILIHTCMYLYVLVCTNEIMVNTCVYISVLVHISIYYKMYRTSQYKCIHASSYIKRQFIY